MFQKAQRSQVFIKLAITGPTGSGKTFSALRLATGLVSATGKRIAVADTENDSASLYSDLTEKQCERLKIPAPFDFDVTSIPPPYDASEFSKAVKAAVDGGYGVLIIDSASHFWKGILSFKDAIDSRGGNSYTNWKVADAKFDPVIADILQSKIHIIFCMRSKMDYILEDNGKGKQAPRKVGLAPIMREGMEYEFTTVFDVALDHSAVASKDRSGLFSEKVFTITEETGAMIHDWLTTAKVLKEHPDAVPMVAASGAGTEEIWSNVTPGLIRMEQGGERDKAWTAWYVAFSNGQEAGTLDPAIHRHCLLVEEKIVKVKKSTKGKWQITEIDAQDGIPE